MIRIDPGGHCVEEVYRGLSLSVERAANDREAARKERREKEGGVKVKVRSMSMSMSISVSMCGLLGWTGD